MENDTHITTEIDKIIKDALINYKISVEVADWTRVENALTVTPKKTSFNWKATAIIIILIGLLGGGYFLYLQFPFTLSISKSIVTAPSEETTPLITKEKTITSTPAPLAPNKSVAVNHDTINNASEVTIADENDSLVSGKGLNLMEQMPIVTNKNSKIDNDITASSVERTSKKQPDTKTEIKKTDKLNAVSEKNLNSTKKAEKTLSSADQNKNAATKIEPTTTSDSEKTATVEKVPPKEEVSKPNPRKTPKAATPSSAGWNTLMFSNINADSLKKYRERMKKDSIQ
jgi:hypothetical protein